MKRIFNALGLMLAATLTLTNCTKNIETPVVESEGVPFEIVASTVETKTVNDGMSTLWAAGDQINVFHVLYGDEIELAVNDKAFTVKDVEAGIFTGELSETLDEQAEYQWYALYPYNSKVTTPGVQSAGYTYIGHKNGLSQNGYGSMAALAGSVCPLYGFCERTIGDEIPEIEMQHLSSVIAINVTNQNDEPLTLTSASFTAEEDIVGSYYISVAGGEVSYKASGATYVSNTATVNVSNGTALAKGESAVLYLAVKPFVARAGTSLVLSVNGYEKEIELSNDATFTAGKIKTVNFAYDKAPVEGLSLPWYEDFSSKDLSKYNIVNGGTDTKIYENDNLAGGKAPELLLAKSGGRFSATIATGGYVGKLTLTFKSNYPDRVTVSSYTAGVTVSKVSTTEYHFDVTESMDNFDVVFSNTNNSNARIDDILLVEGVQLAQTLTFAQPAFSFYIGSDEAAAFVGQTVQGAKTKVTYSSNNTSVAEVDAETGAVTLKDVEGSAIITATAEATEEYKEAVATYIVALSKKNEGEAKQYTFTITKDDFNTTSYAANNNEKTSVATAADGTEMEVKWTSYQVMNQNSTIQWQKSKGYIYNSTDLGVIDNITITSTAGTFTQYIGATLQPTTSGEGGYFQIKVGSATGKVTSIKVTFTK